MLKWACFNTGPYEETELFVCGKEKKTQQRKYIIIDIALRFLIYLLIVIRVASSVCHQRV
jgi:hypothetical protein